VEIFVLGSFLILFFGYLAIDELQFRQNSIARYLLTRLDSGAKKLLRG